MSQLQIVNVRRISTFSDRDDVIKRRAPRIRKGQVEINRPPAYGTDRLGGVYDFLCALICAFCPAVFIWSVSARHVPPAPCQELLITRKRPAGISPRATHKGKEKGGVTLWISQVPGITIPHITVQIVQTYLLQSLRPQIVALRPRHEDHLGDVIHAKLKHIMKVDDDTRILVRHLI